MRLPFQTFTQRDVPQFATPQPMQVATPAAPVVPSLGGDTQLQQVRATTRLVDSIVGAVTSYKSMEKAFEQRDEQDRLKAERELEKKASEDALAAHRKLEPKRADLLSQVRLGTLPAEDAIKEMDALYKEELGEGSRAYHKLADNNAGWRGNLRSIEMTRVIADREDDVAALATEQDRALAEILNRQTAVIENDPYGFDVDAAQETREIRVNQFIREYEQKLVGLGYSESEVEKRVSARRGELQNIDNQKQLEFTQTARKLELGNIYDQATLLFDAGLERQIAFLQENPLPPTAFDKSLNYRAETVFNALLEDPRLSGLTATQESDLRKYATNELNSKINQLRSQNIDKYKRDSVNIAVTRASAIINDTGLDGVYRGAYAPYSDGNEAPVEQKASKDELRKTHENAYRVGAYGSPALESSKRIYLDTLSRDLGRFDEARVDEWFLQEFPGVELAVAELEKGGDGAFPNIPGDKRKQLIMEGRSLVKRLKAEQAAGNRPYQREIKTRLEDHIMAVANGEPVSSNAFVELIENSDLEEFDRLEYFQKREYASYFNDKKSQLGGPGGLEDMTFDQLNELKADLKPSTWEVATGQPEKDRDFTEILNGGLYPEFVKQIDEVLNRRKNDPAGMAEEEMDRKGYGREGDFFDPERRLKAREIQKNFNQDQTPVDLPKAMGEQIKDTWDAAEGGNVDQAVVGGRDFTGQGYLVRGRLASMLVGTEDEATRLKIEREGVATQGFNLVGPAGKAVGEPAASMYLLSDFYNAGDIRKLARLHEAMTMDSKGVADQHGIDLKAVIDASIGNAEVMKAISVTPGTSGMRDAKAGGRVLKIIQNYTLTLIRDNPDLSPEDAIEEAAAHFIDAQGGSFAQSSSLGDSGAYVPIPKGADPGDYQSALSDISYWVDAKRDSIKTVMGSDQYTNNLGLVVTSGSWKWVAVGDGSLYQLYAGAFGDAPTPVIINQADIANYLEGKRPKPGVWEAGMTPMMGIQPALETTEMYPQGD